MQGSVTFVVLGIAGASTLQQQVGQPLVATEAGQVEGRVALAVLHAWVPVV